MRPTALAKQVVLSLEATRAAIPASAPETVTRRKIPKRLLPEVVTSTQSSVTLVRRCGKRHLTVSRTGGGARVRLMGTTTPSAVDRTKFGTSALAVAESGKELTVVGRPVGTSQKGSLRLRVGPMGSGEVGAVVRRRNRKMMKL
jgi:hypothetical protein